MKKLRAGLVLSIIVYLAVLTCFANASDSIHLDFCISDSIPVGIDSPLIYRNYSSEEYFHTIEFSLTNKSKTYIGMVSFTQYELDEKNEVLSTTFWSERDGLRPYETKRLSTNDSSIKENTKIVWSVHRICTDKGTWSIDLNDLVKAIPTYVRRENLILPTARFDERKCRAE